ncbi:ATP synthase F1 subunit delta [Mycoplasma todarodis]|uniref:ATP synthase subunit delta n=1 Tax=Mycoplasma todarodis TaxID=1937191 RepID=A0A4R0XIW7_9MOLU|nr:ATP synthase F1 subunit delta [Mycoplasma todarodis]TCG10354.1 ATP synthase F1 subunit delta [Mycoplasma todarodis]
MQLHVNGYSLALLDIAQEEKKLDNYKEQAMVIVEVFTKNPTYINILGSYAIDTQERLALVEKAFSNKLEQCLKNFISLLVEKKRVEYIVPSLKRLISLINEEKNIHEGIAYSVSKLTAKQLKDILVNKLDSELISGVKVVVGDQVIDNSIATKLQNLRQQLLEGQVQ